MTYTVAQAAKAIGKSKATVLRAISSGRISAARDEATGAFQIEPIELHRVFPPVLHDAGDALHEAVNGASRGDAFLAVRQAEARIADKDTVIAGLESTVDDLRRRLDRADEQRQQAQTQLAALLADQRPDKPTSGPAPRRSSWRPWRRK